MSIELGQQAKDSITGYKGTVAAKMFWLYGCIRVGIQGPLDKDKKVPDVIWFDEDQMIVLPIKSKAKKRTLGATPAGPRVAGSRKAAENR